MLQQKHPEKYNVAVNPGPEQNSTIAEAQGLLAVLESFGLTGGKIVAVPVGVATGSDEYPVADLISEGVSTNTPFNLYIKGIAGSDMNVGLAVAAYRTLGSGGNAIGGVTAMITSQFPGVDVKAIIAMYVVNHPQLQESINAAIAAQMAPVLAADAGQ